MDDRPPCLWCGAPSVDRFRFEIGRRRLYPHVCVVHREWTEVTELPDREAWRHRETPPGHSTYDAPHECICGHTSTYHHIRMTTDHAWTAGGHGVELCRPCAKFVAAATRSRLQPARETRLSDPAPLELEELDEFFEDPLRDLSDGEVAEAARRFFRKFEGASK